MAAAFVCISIGDLQGWTCRDHRLDNFSATTLAVIDCGALRVGAGAPGRILLEASRISAPWTRVMKMGVSMATNAYSHWPSTLLPPLAI